MKRPLRPAPGSRLLARVSAIKASGNKGIECAGIAPGTRPMAKTRAVLLKPAAAVKNRRCGRHPARSPVTRRLGDPGGSRTTTRDGGRNAERVRSSARPGAFLTCPSASSRPSRTSRRPLLQPAAERDLSTPRRRRVTCSNAQQSSGPARDVLSSVLRAETPRGGVPHLNTDRPPPPAATYTRPLLIAVPTAPPTTSLIAISDGAATLLQSSLITPASP